jgi:hypothetical protein
MSRSISWNICRGIFGHLEGDIAAVAHHLRADFYKYCKDTLDATILRWGHCEVLMLKFV